MNYHDSEFARKCDRMKEKYVNHTVKIESLEVGTGWVLLTLKPIGRHARKWVMNLTEWENLGKPVPNDILYLRFTLPPEETGTVTELPPPPDTKGLAAKVNSLKEELKTRLSNQTTIEEVSV